MQPQLLPMHLVDKDVVYTPEVVTRQIIEYVKPSGRVLDPCMGKGAFYDNFPTNCKKDWCEIDMGRDFLAYDKKVDWIIGNPPYSLGIFRQFLKHSFSLAKNVVFLVPINKVFQSFEEMDGIRRYGGIRAILCYGQGGLIDLPFGFAAGAFWFKRGYKGKVDIEYVKFDPPAASRHPPISKSEIGG